MVDILIPMSSVSLRSHRERLRALRAVTSVVSKNTGAFDLTKTYNDVENSPPSDSEEFSWLQSNDLST